MAVFVLILIVFSFQFPNSQAQGRVQFDFEEGHICVDTDLASGCRTSGTDCRVVTPIQK